MKKYTALLLAAAITLSGCNNNTPNPYIPEEVRLTYEGDGFTLETVTTTWLEEDKMGCIDLKLLSEDNSEVVAESGVIFPWLNVKEMHLADNQYLSVFVTEEYKDGMVMIPRLETRGKDPFDNTVYEFGIYLCNGREIKDVTPFDSVGHPTTYLPVFELSDSGSVPVFGYTDTDGKKVWYELDFENMRIMTPFQPSDH